MMLAAVNLYSLLQYLGLAIRHKAEQLAILRPDRGKAMQDSGYELRRIFLLGTWVNKPPGLHQYTPGGIMIMLSTW
jgi:hypothetical protein